MYAGTGFDCELRGALVSESATRKAIEHIMMSFLFLNQDIFKGKVLPKVILSSTHPQDI